MTKSIFELEKELTNQEILDFELIGSNTQKSMVHYVVSEVPRNQETMLQIKRIEKNYSDNSESEHILHLLTKQKHNNLMVIIDEFPLYEEEKDLSDPIKASIVNEKLNKFDLLFSEKLKPLNQQVLLKKEAEEKEKTFRTVFRDF